jgi:hypothetical protein
MIRQFTLIAGLTLGVTAITAATLACRLPLQPAGPEQTKSETVEAGAAESADVEISLGAGELTVAGGATELMEAEFTFNIDAWEPEVDYSINGDKGFLTVRQPDEDGLRIPDTEVRYTWDLQFNDEVPLDMQVNMGAGEGLIDLRALSVGNLDLRTGAGNVSALLGGSQLTSADISAGIGETTIDLSGDWENDASIVIKAGVGDMTVIVPRQVGVIADVAMGIGEINADGFRTQGGSYTNDAYEDSTITLRVEIDGGVGEITLTVGE